MTFTEKSKPSGAAEDAVPVGEADAMVGSNGGFTMAVFKAVDVPIGTKLYATPPAARAAAVSEEARRALADEAWQDLLEKDDRTSPEEYPDMALISKDELASYMGHAVLAFVNLEAALAKTGSGER